ncbi:MAG: hypothetical protein WC514_01320 [Candidatus Paceibacterota bacterium]
MPKVYTKEQLWELYDKLPKELQEAIFSNETAEYIRNICERYEIKKDEDISLVAKLVGDVLLGISATDDLQKSLETDLKIKKEEAKKMSQEIYRSIFYPVKPILEQISGKEINPVVEKEKETIPPGEPEKKPSSPKKSDTYREPIE